MGNLLHTVVVVLSFWALTHALKNSDLLSRPRAFLIRLHPLFYSLFECYFCLGFWSGLAVYALSFASFSFREMLLYGLSGAAISYITDTVLLKLER